MILPLAMEPQPVISFPLSPQSMSRPASPEEQEPIEVNRQAERLLIPGGGMGVETIAVVQSPSGFHLPCSGQRRTNTTASSSPGAMNSWEGLGSLTPFTDWRMTPLQRLFLRALGTRNPLLLGLWPSSSSPEDTFYVKTYSQNP